MSTPDEIKYEIETPDWDEAPAWAKSFGLKVETGEWCWCSGTNPTGGFIHIQPRPE